MQLGLVVRRYDLVLYDGRRQDRAEGEAEELWLPDPFGEPGTQKALRWSWIRREDGVFVRLREGKPHGVRIIASDPRSPPHWAEFDPE